MTLSNVNQDITRSQALLEVEDSTLIGSRLNGMTRNQNASIMTTQVHGIKSKPTVNCGGGTGGPPEKDLQLSQKGGEKQGELDVAKMMLNENSEDGDSERQMVCRICLSETERENPLICPCKCSGSMG